MNVNKYVIGIIFTINLGVFLNVPVTYAEENNQSPLIQAQDKVELYKLQNDYNVLLEQINSLDSAIKNNVKNYDQMKKKVTDLHTSSIKKEKEVEKLREEIERQMKRANKIQEKSKVSRYFGFVFGTSEDPFYKRIGAGFGEIGKDEQFLKEHEKKKEKIDENIISLDEAKKSIGALKVEMLGNLDIINQQKEQKIYLMKDLEIKEKELQNVDNIAVEKTSSKKETKDNSVGDFTNGRSKAAEIPISNEGFTFPTIGTIATTYGYRHGVWENGIAIRKNSEGVVPVISVADGIVTKSLFSNSEGNVIHIQHTVYGKEFESVYSHLDTRVVQVGETVDKGTYIGTMGTTGESDEIHLHLELLKNIGDEMKTVNPLLYIPLPKD
ncbi:murein hydrolase activator EnvC family protein [Metabacillus fastidiosus]|uniref:murein hydrolase activator EnvC family protein n=1 Tax=Metabacillus fastidiosus TaxID=1458 RepID=UPI0008258A8A|nr:peptidoglycan DD-metalloendopeptidase family protein [Metabacillus fastidiosus]